MNRTVLMERSNIMRWWQRIARFVRNRFCRCRSLRRASAHDRLIGSKDPVCRRFNTGIANARQIGKRLYDVVTGNL
jgi:hypothetical protein